MAGLTQQQILQQIGRTGWRFTGAVRDETVTKEVPGKNEFGDPAMIKQEVPTGKKIMGITGPNGEPDEIVVKQVQTARPAVASPGSTDPSQPAQPDLFELVKGPSNEPPKPPSTDAKPAKGTRRIVQSGGQWVQEIAVDDKGTWSVETGPDGKPLSVAVDKPATTDTSPTTKTVNGHTFQYDPKTNTWPEASGLPVSQDDTNRPPAPTVNTTAQEIPEWDGSKWVWKPNPNVRTPDEALTAGERAKDAATATNAQATSDTALATAQTALATANQNLTNAQTDARQKPTDAQAQQAVQNALRQQELAISQVEAALKQAGNLNPIAVQQAQATLAQTQQNVTKGLQGDLYGRREQLQQIRDLLASGDIKTVEEADAMTAALNRGTTVYDAMKQAQADRQAARTQDVSNRNQLASTFGSTFTSGLSTLSDMNKYAPVGSTAGADAFVALLNMSQQRLKDYEVAPAQETNYLAPLTPSPVGNMVNAAQQQMATAPQPIMPQPSAPAAPSGGATFTFNIGSGAASNPQGPTPNLLPAGATGTASDPHAQPYTGGGPMSSSGDMLARSAAQQTPATNGEVISTLFPNMAKRFGLLTE